MAIDWTTIGQIVGALTVGAGGSWMAARKSKDKDLASAVKDLTTEVQTNRGESTRRFDDVDEKIRSLSESVKSTKDINVRLTLLEAGIAKTVRTATRRK